MKTKLYTKNEYFPLLSSLEGVDAKIDSASDEIIVDITGEDNDTTEAESDLNVSEENLNKKIALYHQLSTRAYSTRELKFAAERAATMELSSFVKRVSDRLNSLCEKFVEGSIKVAKLLDAQSLLVSRRLASLQVGKIDPQAFKQITISKFPSYAELIARTQMYTMIVEAYAQTSTIVNEPVKNVEDLGKPINNVLKLIERHMTPFERGNLEHIEISDFIYAKKRLYNPANDGKTIGELGYSVNDILKFSNSFDNIIDKYYRYVKGLFGTDTAVYTGTKFKLFLDKLRSTHYDDDSVLPAEAAKIRMKRLQILTVLNTRFLMIYMLEDVGHLRKLLGEMLKLQDKNQ